MLRNAKRRHPLRLWAASAALVVLSCDNGQEGPSLTPLPLAVISAPARSTQAPHGSSMDGKATSGDDEEQGRSNRQATDGRLAAIARLERATERFDQAFPSHGQAFHVLAQVFARPSTASPIAGYYRRGGRLRARAVRTKGAQGCDQRWYELSTGGFVCRGRGFIVSEAVPSFEPAPAPPARTDILPYRYLKNVSNGAPQYWRLPSAVEEQQAKAAIKLVQSESPLEAPEAPGSDSPTQVAPPDAPQDASVTGDRTEHATGADSSEGDTDGDTQAGRDPRLPDYVRMPMGRGFYISRGRHESNAQHGAQADTTTGRYVRSIRGAYAERKALVPGAEFEGRGHRLTGARTLPLGIVYRPRAKTLRERLDGAGFAPADVLSQFDALALTERAQRIERGRYQLARDGRWVPVRALRTARLRARPRLVPRHERWIHVDLAEQVLVAYEGDRPVFATLVSTGKAEHETPTGLYRIQAKHISTTMDGSAGSDEAYSIEDVPWTMYFHGSFALHGAFWHQRFGRVRSHGCVNLAPADAKFLFDWSTPSLPEGWHGVLTQPKAHSTYVFIE